MQRIICCFLVAVTTSACESMPWERQQARVDDALLMEVSDADRAEIADLRSESARMSDELAFAEREIEKEKARRKIAAKELDIANKEVQQAEARLEALRADPTAAPDGLREAREALDAAHVHVAWARDQVEYHESRIEWARSKHELAQRRVELADARVELRKARAVEDLEMGAPPDIDVDDYEQAVHETEMAVELAEIDAEAWKSKTENRWKRMKARAEEVPKQLRTSWRIALEAEK